MIRKIIHIDEEKCNGCGLCAKACHEGAIGMVGGKARLLRDDYCDGLGDCLPACPTGAISFRTGKRLPMIKPLFLKNNAAPATSSQLVSGRSRLNWLRSTRLTSTTPIS